MARKELPAAVVLEIGLPRLDGWQVLAELKADPAHRRYPRGHRHGRRRSVPRPGPRRGCVPAQANSSRGADRCAPKQVGAPVTPRRILVVEDNPLNLKLVRDVLDVRRLRRHRGAVRGGWSARRPGGSPGSGADGPPTPGHRRNRDAAQIATRHTRPARAGRRGDGLRDGRGQGTGISRRLRRIRREADQRAGAARPDRGLPRRTERTDGHRRRPCWRSTTSRPT